MRDMRGTHDFPHAGDVIQALQPDPEGCCARLPVAFAPEETSKGRYHSRGFIEGWTTCPKCQGPMRVISFIEDQGVIKKIRQRRTSPQPHGALGSETAPPSPHKR
jgi:hypothetical protein